VSRTILVVDDDPLIRRLIATTLEDVAGFDLVEAGDGIEALERAAEETPSIVFLDIDMPRMDGIELVRRIRQDAALRQLPVMVVSYKDREQDRQRGLEAGADYYLAKGSFHDAALLDAVQDLIGEARS
jgi:two-component system, chemotaxis family, sensor histidine kinase and response regulator WspE